MLLAHSVNFVKTLNENTADPVCNRQGSFFSTTFLSLKLWVFSAHIRLYNSVDVSE